MKIHAPFTAEQVQALNEYQNAGYVHPFTCGNDHHGDNVLVATEAGWVCPNCEYVQHWAHEFMTTWSPAMSINVTIMMNPSVLPTVEQIAHKLGFSVSPLFPNTQDIGLQRYFKCYIQNRAGAEDLAQWLMEAVREVPGVEAASIKPHSHLAEDEWKVME